MSAKPVTRPHLFSDWSCVHSTYLARLQQI